MNELEKLSKENKENYLRYLKRMTESMKTSTKGLIPVMCSNSKNILDVGCGSGVVMEAIEEINANATISGLDLNIESIEKLRRLGKNWKLYHMNILDMHDMKFDTIIYSSVLHEISSYCPYSKYRFTSEPIREAFRKTNELLEMNGSIILRDGLLVPKDSRNEKVHISFSNPDEIKWLFRFQNDFQGFKKMPDVDRAIVQMGVNDYLVGLTFLKEFLYTYTWGAESYPREVKERFGILSKEEWISLLEGNGFSIETIIESKEEYEKYLSPKVTLNLTDGTKFIYPIMTILIKAKKNKELVKSR